MGCATDSYPGRLHRPDVRGGQLNHTLTYFSTLFLVSISDLSHRLPLGSGARHTQSRIISASVPTRARSPNFPRSPLRPPPRPSLLGECMSQIGLPVTRTVMRSPPCASWVRTESKERKSGRHFGRGRLRCSVRVSNAHTVRCANGKQERYSWQHGKSDLVLNLYMCSVPTLYEYE